jgi:hypothetical protein
MASELKARQKILSMSCADLVRTLTLEEMKSLGDQLGIRSAELTALELCQYIKDTLEIIDVRDRISWETQQRAPLPTIAQYLKQDCRSNARLYPARVVERMLETSYPNANTSVTKYKLSKDPIRECEGFKRFITSLGG